MKPISEASYLIVMCAAFLIMGCMLGLKHGNPIFDIVEVVYVNSRSVDMLGSNLYHVACHEVIYPEGLE